MQEFLDHDDKWEKTTVTIEGDNVSPLPEGSAYFTIEDELIDFTGKYLGLDEHPDGAGEVETYGRPGWTLLVDDDTYTAYLRSERADTIEVIGSVKSLAHGDEPARLQEERDPDDPDGSITHDTYVGTRGTDGPRID